MKIVNYCLLLPAAIGQGTGANIFGGAVYGDTNIARYPYPGGGRACTMEAKVCPDGSSVGRTGPNCEFSPCPGGGGGRVCTMEVRACPDGSSVGRTGPNCEFAPCPGGGGGGRVCTMDAKVCPDGSSVGRTGPNCEFAPCPGGGGGRVCTMDAKVCPDGSSVGRTGPNCEFAPCPGGNPTFCTADAKICPDGRTVGRTGPNCQFDCSSGGTDPWNPSYPTWPTYPSWPSYPTYPSYPSWPSNPTYPGMASCWSHSQCGSGQYCYSCSRCMSTPGCPMTTTCRSNPSGGECATLANCERDQDAIDGVCPGSWGGGGNSPCSTVLCPRGQRCIPEPKQCFTTPCPQYRCEGDYGGGTSVCAAVTCPVGQQCVAETSPCFNPLCPPFRCEPIVGGGGWNPCQPNPCRWDQQCVRTQIYCITTPCPQYQCIGGGSGGGSQQCGANEVWESCGSSSCWEQKCSDSGPWPPRGCTFDCRSGCKCKEGFKRNYNGECTEFCYVLGRPYSSDKGFLVAPVLSTPSIHTTVSSAIETNASDPLFANMLTEEQLSKAANYWAKVAMMEHASVASFSRFSLELMSVGASPELLALAHQAALDEVRHTQISLDIANQFSSTTFTPGAFPISSKAADFAFGDMEKIASAAALEACIEETLAAAVVLYQAEHMGDANHKSVLRAVALDEATHAAFAWRAVQWMASTSPAVHSAVSAVFSERAKQHEVAPETASVPSLEQLGLLDQGTIAKVQYNAWHQVVVPAAVSLGFLPAGDAPASTGDAQPVADVIAHAIMSCNQTPVA